VVYKAYLKGGARMDSRLEEMATKLKNYFRRDERLKSLNGKLKRLKDQLAEIEYKLENTDIHIPEESLAISYEERVQGGHSVSGFAEKATIRIIRRLEERQAWYKSEIAYLEEKIDGINLDNGYIEDNIGMLEKGDYEFIKKKYGEDWTDERLGMKYGVSQVAATDRKNGLLKNIADWEIWKSHDRETG